MSRIFWDSNLFIYLFEENPQFVDAVSRIRERMLEREDQLLTSILTLGEILVKPHGRGALSVCEQYERVLNSTTLILPFDARAARKYASIRNISGIKGPDAIQLACASEAGVDLFITNDTKLPGKQIEGIQFIVPLDRVPL